MKVRSTQIRRQRWKKYLRNSVYLKEGGKMRKIISICLCLLVYWVFARTEEEKKDLLDVFSEISGYVSNHKESGNNSEARLTIPLETSPYWSSPSLSGSVWGVYLVDITKDGYPEVIVVGENMTCYLFSNDNGSISSTPSWQSSDADRSIWASFGDYDNDGDLDMAVANYSFAGGQTKVYRNDNGILTQVPIWTAGSGTWCEWGDVDNDGDLDLAMVDMFVYPSVFRNNSGVLESTPFWSASDHNIDFGGAWIDVDLDGDLELAVTGINWQEPVLRVYNNTAGQLEQAASWSSQLDPNIYTGAMPSVGDIDRNGWLDMATPMGWLYDDNSNAVHSNLAGVLEQMPSWFSNNLRPSTSGVLGDLNGDGYLDWAVNDDTYGGVVYENLRDALNPSPSWQSSTQGGLGIDLGDVDQDGIRYKEDTVIVDGTKRLFYLSNLPIHKFVGVTIDGDSLSVREYCYSAKAGWVSLRDSVTAGSQVVFGYYHSVDMELLLSDYYNSQAHLFNNNNNNVAEKIGHALEIGFRVYPNPVLGKTAIEFSYISQQPAFAVAELYDCLGRKITTMFKQKVNSGFHKEKIPVQFSSGAYFLRLKINNESFVKKVMVIK